jgi:hypothetical protein
MRARWLAIAAVCLASVCAVSGQAADPAPAVTTPAEQGHFYNLDTERQVEGTIQEVLFEPRYEDRAPFLVIVLKEKNTGRVFRVEVSPAWFFNYDLHQREPVKVTGSVYTRDDSSYLIARKLQAGGETFMLRDSRGFPSWRGGPMKVKGGRRGRGI